MKTQLMLALALAAAPFATLAGGHSYTYIEGGYAQLNQELPDVEGFEVDDIEAGGFYIGGSAALGEMMYIFGNYRDGDDDVGVSLPGVGEIGSTGIDMNQYAIGLGYHQDLSSRTDLVAELSLIGTEIEVDGEGSQDGDDARVAVGVRHMIADSVDVWAKGNYTDGDVYDGEFSATVGLQYRMTPVWGIVGEAELGSEFSQVTAGIRASF